jgi:outer membrane protein assembly factor BamB
MGFLYVLSAADGSLRDGFPVQMNEIQGQVVPADVDGDGALELVAVDAAGSVAAWRHDGSPLWEVQASSLSVQGVTIVSLRDDGAVQVIVPTSAGVVHIFEGATGTELGTGSGATGFPLRTGGRILSSVLAVHLSPPELAPPLLGRGAGVGGADSELHLVFSSFDGHVYVVNARSGCYDRLDLGEDSYTQVLADDLTGNGMLDLLVSTMNGHLFCFETDTPWTPLRAWRSQAQGRNVFQPREGFQGVVISGVPSGRHAPRAVTGVRFPLEIELHDARRVPGTRVHRLEVRLGRELLLNRTYELREGAQLLVVREELPSPAQPFEGLLTVQMTNEHGQYFEDVISMSVNAGFESILKYVTLLPLAAATIAMTLASIATRTPLPI